jgi:hypothetical protein
MTESCAFSAQFLRAFRVRPRLAPHNYAANIGSSEYRILGCVGSDLQFAFFGTLDFGTLGDDKLVIGPRYRLNPRDRPTVSLGPGHAVGASALCKLAASLRHMSIHHSQARASFVEQR